MKVVTYFSSSGPRAGVLREGGVADVHRPAGGTYSSVAELLATDGIDEARRVPEDAELQSGVALLAPVHDPEKIVCLGLNYRSHAAEAKQELPESPVIFGKWNNALVGPEATVPIPAASEKVDFEAEVAFVVGRPAKDVSEADAMDHVAGYTLLNDLSARDLQFRGPQWMAGKVFDGSAPCGPALVTPDEAGAHDAIEFALHLNGERMQESSTADLIFSVPELLADLSTLMTLRPGDIVATGTPAGVGSTRKPRVWLKPGDEVVISSPTLGELRTLIA